MNPPLQILDCTQIGERKACGFVEYNDGTGGWAEWSEPVYEDSPQGELLRKIRVEEGEHVTLSQAAKALSISVVDLSSLERGRKTLSPVDWERAFAAIRALKGAKAP
jgi:hypothetical protein